MTKQEFEALFKQGVRQDEWEKIHTVYQFHPSIDEVEGKQQIADLLKTFGMPIIEDMLPRAYRIQDLEIRKQTLKKQLADVDEQIKQVSLISTR